MIYIMFTIMLVVGFVLLICGVTKDDVRIGAPGLLLFLGSIFGAMIYSLSYEPPVTTLVPRTQYEIFKTKTGVIFSLGPNNIVTSTDYVVCSNPENAALYKISRHRHDGIDSAYYVVEAGK